MKPPKPGIVLGNCQIIRVLDGDTVEVAITRKVHIRLLDCWAPEVHQTKHPNEKRLGINAKNHAELLVKHKGAACVLEVPSDGDEDLGDGLTFGRVLGNVWFEDGTCLNVQMVQDGLCYLTKAELEEFLTQGE